MMIYYLLDITAVTCALVCLRSWLSRRKRLGLPFPPGPKGFPIIGNVFDMPEVEEWETARQWGEKYGGLVFVKIFGTPYLFLNTYQVTVDLFEKRGHTYSSRPKNVMLELEGWAEWFPAVMPYGDELRKARQYMHRFFQQSASRNYIELQTQATHRMLSSLLKYPEDCHEHIRHWAGETILMVTYGYEAAEKDDPFVKLAYTAFSYFTQAEGFFLVNAFPRMRHLPAWFPGGGFKKISEEGRRLSMALYHEPHELAKKKLFDGTAIPSMTSKLIEANVTEDGVIAEEALIAKCTGVAYGAGADTTISALLTFLLAMILYPEHQRRGQEELDKVVGKDNLPTYQDRPNLPFVDALAKETLRWQTVTAWGIAHCATEDDVFGGYFIPAGTTVLSNLWAMLRDPNEYPEPDKFIPDRWLPSEGKELPMDVNKITFGIGRRICPGRHFAENAIFLGIASILSTLNIEKALDKNGVPITPKEEYTPNFVRHPKPFKSKITPRSDKIEPLIRQAVESAR